MATKDEIIERIRDDHTADLGNMLDGVALEIDDNGTPYIGWDCARDDGKNIPASFKDTVDAWWTTHANQLWEPVEEKLDAEAAEAEAEAEWDRNNPPQAASDFGVGTYAGPMYGEGRY